MRPAGSLGRHWASPGLKNKSNHEQVFLFWSGGRDDAVTFNYLYNVTDITAGRTVLVHRSKRCRGQRWGWGSKLAGGSYFRGDTGCCLCWDTQLRWGPSCAAGSQRLGPPSSAAHGQGWKVVEAGLGRRNAGGEGMEEE